MNNEPNNASAAVAHTQGPWEIGHEHGNSRDEIDAADGRTVAIVWTRRAPAGATARVQFKDDPELQANAHLIAAAPELLAALKLTLNAMLNHAGWNLNHAPDGKELPMTRPADVQAAEEAARAALAKAKGAAK